MQEPTTRRHAAPEVTSRFTSRANIPIGLRAGRWFVISAVAAGIISLPLLGIAAGKKAAHPTRTQVSTNVPASASVSSSGTPVFPTVPVTASALKVAQKAQPGQIIPVPETAKPAVPTPLAKVLSGDSTGTQTAPAGAQSASESTRPSTFTVRETRTQIISPRSIIQMSHDVAPGETSFAHHGKPGLLVRTYDVTYRDGKPIHYQLISAKVVKAPVNEVLLAGVRTREARALPSRYGMYNRVRELDMVATGYSPYEGSGSGRCATGIRAGYGVVAVDPRVIPLGTHLYIEGYGYAIAGDTGGAIRHNRIDLGMNSYRQANRVGRRRVHVYILSEMR